MQDPHSLFEGFTDADAMGIGFAIGKGMPGDRSFKAVFDAVAPVLIAISANAEMNSAKR